MKKLLPLHEVIITLLDETIQKLSDAYNAKPPDPIYIASLTGELRIEIRSLMKGKIPEKHVQEVVEKLHRVKIPPEVKGSKVLEKMIKYIMINNLVLFPPVSSRTTNNIPKEKSAEPRNATAETIAGPAL